MPFSDNTIIIAITCVISYYALQNRRFLSNWILNPYTAKRKNLPLQYISYGFVHADYPHLIFNMVTLYFFGRYMQGFYQELFAGFGYYIFYFGALICSVMPSSIPQQNNPNYSTLGASGAVSAVLFAFILLQPWSLIYVYFIPVPAIIYGVAYTWYSIYLDKKGGDNINHSAHLWGAAYGVLFTLVMRPESLSTFLERLTNP